MLAFTSEQKKSRVELFDYNISYCDDCNLSHVEFESLGTFENYAAANAALDKNVLNKSLVKLSYTQSEVGLTSCPSHRYFNKLLTSP